MEKEQWRDIEGYPTYQVSDMGRVRRIDVHLLTPDYDAKGYIRYRLYGPKGKRGLLAHRLVALAFLENSDSHKTQVNHRDGNPGNPALYNVEWMTPKENAIHARKILKRQCGEKNPRAKLKDDDVFEILRFAAEGKSRRWLGEYFGVTSDNISKILNGTAWSHVHAEPA